MSNEASATVTVKVAPRSSRNCLKLEENGTYKAYLTAPPVDGKANDALIKLLSQQAGIPKSSITIIHGETSRLKTVSIKGISQADANDRLSR